MSKPSDVDSYIANADINSRPLLSELRELILSTVPDAQEKISYNVPFYKYYGEFVGFSVFKKHVSFGFGADILSDKDRKILEAKGYSLGKCTLQIKLHQEIPINEIKDILIKKANLNKMKQLGK